MSPLLAAALAVAFLLHLTAGIQWTRPLRRSPHRARYVAKFGWLNVHLWPVLLYPTLNLLLALRPSPKAPPGLLVIRYRHPEQPGLMRRRFYEHPHGVTPMFSVLTVGDEWVELLGGDAARRRPGLLQMFHLERSEGDDCWRGAPRRGLVATRGVRSFSVDLRDPAETVVSFEADDPGSVRSFLAPFLEGLGRALPGVEVEVESEG